MNFSTTCLRYSKFISLESFKSELLVTVTEALGTSEFARSSGTSLSGLIFYKKKKKQTHRGKREVHCRLRQLDTGRDLGSGYLKRVVSTTGYKLGINSFSYFMGSQQRSASSSPYTAGQELVDVSVLCTFPKPAWNWLHGGSYPLVIFSYH